MLVTTAIQLLSPWVLKYAIDDLTRRRHARRSCCSTPGCCSASRCVSAVFRFLMRRILIGASRDIEYDIRNEFFARLQQMPLAYYQARRTGDLMSRATNDLNAVRMMIGPAVMYSANTILVFVVAIILMMLDRRAADADRAACRCRSCRSACKYFGSAIHTRFEAIQAQLADISAVVQEALAGVRVVRAYGQEAHEIERFRDGQRGVRPAQPRADPAAGAVLSEHDALSRASARCWCSGSAAARSSAAGSRSASSSPSTPTW